MYPERCTAVHPGYLYKTKAKALKISGYEKADGGKRALFLRQNSTCICKKNINFVQSFYVFPFTSYKKCFSVLVSFCNFFMQQYEICVWDFVLFFSYLFAIKEEKHNFGAILKPKRVYFLFLSPNLSPALLPVFIRHHVKQKS